MIGGKQLGGILLVAALAASDASAFGWLRPTPTWSAAYCYYPAPVYAGWAYAYPVTHAHHGGVPLAIPTAAPPSTGEPPLLKKVEMPPADKGTRPGPNVFEARSPSPTVAAAPKDRCRVGFWNLTGRDVTLVIAGQAHAVARDRAVTLELPRDFFWRIGEQPSRSERIAADKATHEIVIR